MTTPRTVCVFCSSAQDVAPRYHDVAAATGQAIAARGWTLLYGGTPTGTMGTLAEAARDGGARVVGVCLPQFVDLGIHDTAADELDVVESLGQRKDEMIRRSDAFVSLPGGYGTLDETVEVISQRQLGYHDKPLVLLDHDGFFTPLLAFFELLQAQRFAPPRMRGAYEVADTAEGAVTTVARLLAPPPDEDA